MQAFIRVYKLETIAQVNQMILMQALMDYFSDIYRLKKYQGSLIPVLPIFHDEPMLYFPVYDSLFFHP